MRFGFNFWKYILCAHSVTLDLRDTQRSSIMSIIHLIPGWLFIHWCNCTRFSQFDIFAENHFPILRCLCDCVSAKVISFWIKKSIACNRLQSHAYWIIIYDYDDGDGGIRSQVIYILCWQGSSIFPRNKSVVCNNDFSHHRWAQLLSLSLSLSHSHMLKTTHFHIMIMQKPHAYYV